ncbi:UDP-glucuronosyl/UDP-glucosyltransferase [Macrophomina phaseolina MS6]|uniref:UDP-glucuronosyl/UDP-glucosyltransferase n=1 Tax=Macrophomina phaseolina (strain MS6) TaxID=1126212 RepID=K2RZQ6_MACPH|nr:UDP-glucuronosyl/UDP-glucosyltransferase [Macrophomina phaseolina MS6]
MASAPPPGDSRAATAAEPNPLSQAAEAIAAAERDNARRSRYDPSPSAPATPGDAERPGSFSRVPTSASSHHSRQDQEPQSPSDAIPAEAPPPYSETIGNIAEDGDLGTRASVADDGRVNIRIDQKNRRLSSLLVPALRSQVDAVAREPALPAPYIPPSLGGEPGKEPPPPINIVIHVVGSRGDVQPFVALGKVLKETYGHRVRLATHPTFKGFVEENGLEFFSIGGDPAELMAFMVKNPGLMPGFDTLRNGDVGKRRRGIAEIIEGCWRSCIESGDGFGVDSEGRTEAWVNSPNYDPQVPANTTGRPFVADAIIANPPSFAHVHCAEKLGIPLHMMFTMPWSPTQAFPHPLANIQSTNADSSLTNYMSYALVDMLTWQGLGDIINRFRQRTLHLEAVSSMAAPGMLHRMRIPYTYCWSPALIPKPKDWGNFISISGFYFLSLASNYHPDPELAAFLKAGPPPVYIGFGSIVLDDPDGMTKTIFDAVKKAGVRALVSKGWGGFGADQIGIPDGVHMLGNVPHDWLFKHVSCVVHHGGAGTTSAGISCGKPTVVVPFFGDQPFWGAMVARAGAGPEPIPHKQLTSDKLAEAIQYALKPSSQERAQELAAKISEEKGCDLGAQSFHQQLKVDELRCSVIPNRAAVWRVKRTKIRLSALAAVVLANENIISFSDLKLYRPREYEPDAGPWDPVTGVTSAVMGTVTSMMMGVADLPVETLKALRIHPETRNSQAHSRTSSNPRTSYTSPEEASSSARNSTDNRRPLTPGSSASGVSTPLHSEAPQVSVKESYSELHERANTSLQGSVKSGSVCGRNHRSSLGSALERARSRSRSRTRSSAPHSHYDPQETKTTADTENTSFSVESALQSGKGVSRIVGAGMKVPMDVMLGLQRGFHNTSKLYGEEPRQVEKVTGFSSGLKVAGKEFGTGLYEGISGLVTQPLKGAKEEGAGGFIKGFGRGIAGIALKPQAAAFAIPAYTMKGVYMAIRKPFGASIENYIISARTAQGWEEYNKSTAEERALIIDIYQYIASHVKKKKNPGEKEMEAIHALVQKRRQKASGHCQNLQQFLGLRSASEASEAPSQSQPPAASQQQQQSQYRYVPPTTGEPPPHFPSSSSALSPQPSNTSDTQLDAAILQKAEDKDLEEAIRLSLAEVSRGNPDEDRLIERAMRNSIKEMEANPHIDEQYSAEEEAQVLQRVLEQSRLDAEALRAKNGDGGTVAYDADELEEALRRSRLDTGARPAAALVRHSTDSEWDSDSEPASPPTVGEIESGTLASHRSTVIGEMLSPVERTVEEHVAPGVVQGGLQQEGVLGREEGEDEELRRAMEASEREGRERADAEEKAKREEEIVMEYVKKQSLAEEEHRRKMTGDGGGSGAGAGA